VGKAGNDHTTDVDLSKPNRSSAYFNKRQKGIKNMVCKMEHESYALFVSRKASTGMGGKWQFRNP
jgi:hypothetical protein